MMRLRDRARWSGNRPAAAFLPLIAIIALVGIPFVCPPEALAQQEIEKTPSPSFEFHSGFWINLHHFLYLQGRLRNNPGGEAKSGYVLNADSPTAMTPDEKKTWDAALAVYAADWSSRDLVHNGIMVLINNRLAELENCPELAGKSAPECTSGLQPQLVTALDEAAPIYRALWWEQQDRENRAWIVAVAPLVRRMGARLGAELSEIYQSAWPEGRYRVDVSWYAGPDGAYTSLDPVHLTIASHDPRNQGLAGFEMLFQEASYAVAEGVDQTITRQCRQLSKPIPRDLFPSLLFYTTAELVRRTFGDTPELAGLPATRDHNTDASRDGLRAHGWSDYQDVLERYWQLYLDGQISFDTAISRIVAVQ
jgi:hypothetical protein